MRYLLALLLLGVASTGAQQSSVTPGGSGNWQCPHEFGHFPHDTACDKYYSCNKGVATLKTCGNGLAFDATDPDFIKENCDYKYNVDCSTRPELGYAQEEVLYDDFQCPQEFGFFPHYRQCDAYWKCENGVPEFRLCGNGLAFDASNETREDCNYLFAVDCEGRPDLEPPIPTTNCPYLYGIFPDEADCAVFWSCWDGEASRYECTPGLAYDRKARVCNWIDHIPECNSQRALQNEHLVCPAPGQLTATGSFSRHAHPDDCRQYFVCLDGVAREYGCPIGTVFQIGAIEGLGQCTDPENVPGCEDYYGELDLKALRQSQLLLGGGGAGGPVSSRRPRPSNPEEAPVVLPASA